MRGRGGTGTAGPLDIGRVGRALAQPGIDPRHWVSYGTVCTSNAEGTFNFEDGQAVFVGPDGCYVDVLLSPTQQHVTARYSGVQGGPAGTIYTPIRPGDEVLVEIPEGDLSFPPVITRILTAEHSVMPLNPDRTPIWQNDRILVHGANLKVQVRSEGAGAAELVANPDGSANVTGAAVTLGAADATEQLVKGTTYRGSEATKNNILMAAMKIAAASCHAATNPATTMAAVQALGTMLDAFGEAYTSFENQADAYLSKVSKTT